MFLDFTHFFVTRLFFTLLHTVNFFARKFSLRFLCLLSGCIITGLFGWEFRFFLDFGSVFSYHLTVGGGGGVQVFVCVFFLGGGATG